MHDSFAAGAGFPGSYDAIYNKPAGNIFQLFRYIFARRFEVTAAATAIIAQRQHLVVPFEMIGQWLAAVLAAGL